MYFSVIMVAKKGFPQLSLSVSVKLLVFILLYEIKIQNLCLTKIGHMTKVFIMSKSVLIVTTKIL